jgi:signal transduction histidine kinase
VRHSAASRVDVRLPRLDDRLRIVVEDDGVGFDPAAEAAGSGLASMRRRARDSGGTLRVETAPGRGARVLFEMPLAGVKRAGENSGWWKGPARS